ncbi:hypothetical protein DNTS_020914 [Danionella cerebrum]|uniref:Ig-like domain-containing protein n=1 Tax=Danionella cerebrum TaxID=2873325 RepID=A0A553RNP3_9TELE|nr:hypothetical protein DNTS_020914 [Danionella translucida]
MSPNRVDAFIKSNISFSCYSRTSKEASHDEVNFYWDKDAHFKNWLKNPGEDLEMDLFDSDDMNVTFTAASTKTETHVCHVNRGKPSCSPAYTKRVSVKNNTLVLKNLSSKDAGNFTIKHNKDEIISVHKVSVTEGGNRSWIYFLVAVIVIVVIAVVLVCRKRQLSQEQCCWFIGSAFDLNRSVPETHRSTKKIALSQQETSTEPSVLSVLPAEERMPVDQKCTSSVQVISPVEECVPLEEQHTLLKQDVTME